MKTYDFFKKYNLHDSLLESVEYNADERKAVLMVDFCYWQQQSYTGDMKERETAKLLFLM